LILQLTATLQRAYWLVLEVDPNAEETESDCWLCTSTLFASATRFWRSLASTSRQAIPSILTRFPPGALPFANESMTLDLINQTALADAVHAHPESLKHDWVPADPQRFASAGSLASWPPGQMVLCALPAEVQRFLFALQHDDEIFGRIAELKKGGSP